MDPNDAWAANRASQALVKLKRVPEARDLLRDWIAKHPDKTDADTYDALAWLEMENGDARRADDAFHAAERVSKGKDPEAYYGMALIAAQRGDAKHARPAPTLTLAVPGGGSKTIREQIRFDFDSSALRSQAMPILDEIAGFLKSETGIDLVVITGHADKQGDEGYNVKLSEQRAQAVKTALVARGIAGDLLQTKGLGNFCALDEAETQDAYQKNRRVQFAISAGGKVLGEELSCIDRMRKWLKPDLTTEKLISVRAK